MTQTLIPPDELTATAIHVLRREIGLANTARFLSRIAAGQGDYTKEREKLYVNMSVDEICDDIQHRREAGSLSQSD